MVSPAVTVTVQVAVKLPSTVVAVMTAVPAKVPSTVIVGYTVARSAAVFPSTVNVPLTIVNVSPALTINGLPFSSFTVAFPAKLYPAILLLAAPVIVIVVPVSNSIFPAVPTNMLFVDPIPQHKNEPLLATTLFPAPTFQ